MPDPPLDAGEGHRRTLILIPPVVEPVSVQFAAFAPASVDALPGDTVRWSNVSPREHTVTGEDFAGDLPAGARFDWTFERVGNYAYHCTIHPSMTGEVDVRRVTLEPLPTTALVPGTRVELTGRSAAPGELVRVERGVAGGAFATVTSVTADVSGRWVATITARSTGSYRAAVGADVSEARRLLVSARRVRLHRTRRGVSVTVAPSDPYGRILLEQRLRERFGWWPVARRRLDYVSRASFRVRRRAPVRAVLVASDGWTPLATSRVLQLRRHGHRS